MGELRIIVCGGRDYNNTSHVAGVLGKIHKSRGPIYAVIHGNAAGADRAAGNWARCNNVREWPVPAEWSKFGKSAGPRRNKAMLGSGASLVVAFPGGKGTRNMVKQAQQAGIEVIHASPPPQGEAG